MRTIYVLHGCQCQSDCERVEREIVHVRGVKAVEVNLYKATATVDHDYECDKCDLVEAIKRSGCVGIALDATNSVDVGGTLDG